MSEPSLNARPRAVLRNASSSYITLVLGAAVGFVVTPIILHHLGTAGFGVWALLFGTAAYIGLLDTGLGFSTITRVAATEGDGPDALGRLLSTSFSVYCALALVGLLVTGVLVVVFPLVFSLEPRFRTDARLALLFLGSAQGVTFMSMTFTAALLGTGRMYLVNLAGFLVSASTSAAQALVVIGGGGLDALALVQLASALATLGVFSITVRRRLPGVRVSAARFDPNVARRLFALGWRNAVYSVAGTLAFGSDIVLVGLLVGARAAAAYAIALKVYSGLQQAATGVLGAVGPAHAHAAHRSSPERRFGIYCIATSITLSLALCAGAVTATFAHPLLALWLHTVPPGSTRIVRVLCVVLVLQTPGMNSASLLLNSERASVLMRLTLISAGVNLVSSIVLTALVGSAGPALGSLVAVATIDIILFPRKVCALLGQTYARFVRESVRPVLPAVAVLLVVLLGSAELLPSGPWVLAGCGVTALAFFGTLSMLPAGRRVRALVVA